MRKPIFWILLIIILAIVLFVFLKHKPKIMTTRTINPQGAAQITPANATENTNGNHVDTMSSHPENPAATTPSEEQRVLGLDNSHTDATPNSETHTNSDSEKDGTGSTDSSDNLGAHEQGSDNTNHDATDSAVPDTHSNADNEDENGNSATSK